MRYRDPRHCDMPIAICYVARVPAPGGGVLEPVPGSCTQVPDSGTGSSQKNLEEPGSSKKKKIGSFPFLDSWVLRVLRVGFFGFFGFFIITM